ncbi:hypothetical protein D9613_007069 [Agrocybe pediades]|uniref:Uncharacterized protein n=1 Tax=Agrocybe pediades TaxID=84607 RepID=A0A8H4QGQ3_9AGAR|nr:hypothetical protein D9613_007069 [Agrocybe pediades]
MVRIIKAVVAASIVLPALAAPILDTREPMTSARQKDIVKGFIGLGRNSGKIGHAIGSFFGAKHAAQATQNRRRDLQDSFFDLTERDFMDTNWDIAVRNDEIEAREPMSSARQKSIIKGAMGLRNLAGKFGKAIGSFFGAKHAAEAAQNQQRDLTYSDIEAREPMTSARQKDIMKGFLSLGRHSGKIGHALGSFFGAKHAAAAQNAQNPQRRDFEDDWMLESRDIGDANWDIESRDDGVLYVREPAGTLRKVGRFAGKAAKVALKVASFVLIREDGTEVEIPARELYDSELDARDDDLFEVREVDLEERGFEDLRQYAREDRAWGTHVARDAWEINELD